MGRQLDTAQATIDVLAAITDAVGNPLEVLLDGGIRRGTDVVKAVALGARCFFKFRIQNRQRAVSLGELRRWLDGAKVSGRPYPPCDPRDPY